MYDFSKTYYGYSFDENARNEDIVVKFKTPEEAIDAAIKENPNADNVYIFDYYPFKYEVDVNEVLDMNNAYARSHINGYLFDNIEEKDKAELSKSFTKVFQEWVKEMGLYKEFGTFEGPVVYDLYQYKKNLKFEEEIGGNGK